MTKYRIFRPTIGNDCLHEIHIDKEVTVVEFAIQKTKLSTLFPRRDNHKFTWAFPDRKAHNCIDHVLMEFT
jgi:hypothetical protein